MPGDTNIHEVIKDPNPGYHHIIHEVVITNSSAAGRTFSIYHGKVTTGTLGNGQALGVDVVIAAHTFYQLVLAQGGEMHGGEIHAGEIFGVQSSGASDITFSFYGYLNVRDEVEGVITVKEYGK